METINTTLPPPLNNEGHSYQWIENEGLLRDEGTLFGLAGAGIEDKLEAIRDYYRIRKAASQTKHDQLTRKMEELKGGDREHSPTNLIPVILQLLLYIGICYFNFWLERYWLAPAIASIYITLGLYLFGLFSVFIGRSILYNTALSLADGKGLGERLEKGKIYLEEFGIPFVVSLFIAMLPVKAYPLQLSIVAALFFFMLFLFAGKGLVNTVFRARKECGMSVRAFRSIRDRRTAQAELEVTNAMLEELNGEEAYKIKTFASEYRLAAESRHLANGVSIKKLA